jgi:hypothetical protein
MEQQHDEETMPAVKEPTVTLGGTMGLVLVDEGGTKNPAIEAPATEAAAVEEKPEIEEIICPKEEVVAPNVFVLRGSGVMSGCSTKRTTQTRPSANCRE